VSKLKVIYIPIHQIHAYEQNAKLHPKEQVKQIVDSIKEFGFNDPIAIDADGTIIEGHGRLLAAQSMALKEVPTITLDDMTETQKKAYIIAHNKLTMNSGFDFDILKDEVRSILEEIPDFDLSITGFDEGELEAMIEEEIVYDGEVDPDEIPEVPDRTAVNFGDIIEFADGSKIICGDSTDLETFNQLMGTEKAAMVNTDPPYGVAYKSDKFDDIANDDLTEDNLKAFLIQNFKLLHRFTKENPALYIYHASRTHREFEDALEVAGFRVKQQIIWVKNMFSFGRSDYHWKHEPLFYAVKEEANCEWHGDRTGTTIWRDKEALEEMTKEELLDFIDIVTQGSTTWEVSKDATSTYQHPTQKPVELAERAIRNSSRPKEIVLEPFSGSGSTLVGCIRAGRRCYAIEFEPKYVQVAAQRVRDYTGESKVTINGEAVDWDEFIA